MTYTQALQTRHANSMAQRFTFDACRERHAHLIRAAQYGQWFVEALRDAGLPEHRPIALDLTEVLAVVLDALNATHGLIEKAADAENLAPELFPMDVAELDALHAKLTKP